MLVLNVKYFLHQGPILGKQSVYTAHHMHKFRTVGSAFFVFITVPVRSIIITPFCVESDSEQGINICFKENKNIYTVSQNNIAILYRHFLKLLLSTNYKSREKVAFYQLLGSWLRPPLSPRFPDRNESMGKKRHRE